MDTVGGSATYFVSRHHEHPPATLEELLKASAQRDAVDERTDNINATRERRVKQGPSANNCADDESDSDYQHVDDESDDDLDDSETVVDEWRLHATEPREGLYLHEMRRQRSRMDEKEAQWVRGYIKAQRAWKIRTGHSIDEFPTPEGTVHRAEKPRSGRALESVTKRDHQEEEGGSSTSLPEASRLEKLLLLGAIVFVCLSLGVQLYAAIKP